jgi:predicted ATPase/DNA-binding CsgD family transcriptional regulator/tetratricopeptide (TPR) repeat protein
MIPRESLKSREVEVLRLMSDGLSNREIAQQLYIGAETVKWYTKNIYSKLHVTSRKEAARKAQALGLLDELYSAEPRTTGAKHNLPEAATPFIGREDEIEQVNSLLLDENNRFVTILAPGGMGKTRLSLEVARRQLGHHHDGVYFVPLAALSPGNDVVTTVAEQIAFVLPGESRSLQQLLNYLKERSMLVVLDNFEHLLDAASVVTDIITNTPRTKILVTTRERLNAHGEQVYNLRGMVYPTWETSEDALEYDAVKLFMQSARRNRSDFELHPDELDFLARICRLTAGMPLGIELAAAWVDVLSLERIAGEIQQGIDIFETEMRDLPERHRSLRATFERTWNRLTAEGQRIFMSLSVFRGGFTRMSAEAVAGATIHDLRTLAQKALIQIEGHERYAIHELVRQFGASKLEESTELATVQAKHAAYFADFMVEREHDLKHGRQLEGLTLIDPDFENVRLAWRYVVDHHQWEQLPKFRYSIWFYCDLRVRVRETLEMCDHALAVLRAGPTTAEVQLAIGRIRAWSSWFYNFHRSYDLELGNDAAHEAIRILQQFEEGTEDLIIAYHTLVRNVIVRSEDRAAILPIAWHNYRLAQQLGDPTWLGQTASFIVQVGDGSQEREALNQAKKWAEQTGDRQVLWLCCVGDILILWHQRRFPEIEALLDHAENLIAPFNSPWHLAQTCRIMGLCAFLQGDYPRAQYHYTRALRRLWAAGHVEDIYSHLPRLVEVNLHQRNLEMAVAIVSLLDDVDPVWRDRYYDQDRALNVQVRYDELRSKLVDALQTAQLDHLWEQVPKPVLSDLIAELLAQSE